MFKNIIESTCNYINDNKIETLILGMSGGIDSTLCAALAREVCSQSSKDVKLVGRVLPIESAYIETNRGITASQIFCHDYQVNSMAYVYNSIASYFMPRPHEEAFVPPHIPVPPKAAVRHGNIKARLRMINLYDTAQKLNGVVLSTDNYTEYLLGFGPSTEMWVIMA